MPKISDLSLTVGSSTVTLVPAGIQSGDQPSMFVTVGPTLALDQQTTLSHKVTQGSANRNVRVSGTTKSVVTTDGITLVDAVLGFELKLSYPKNTTLAERQHNVDLLIAYLSSQRTVIADTSVYY